MPAEIISAAFCADYWSTFKVESSKKGAFYEVTMNGGEGTAHCTCPAYKHSRDRDCKHIAYVFKHGCFWNPQWYEGGDRTVRPVACHGSTIEEECPGCGGPMIAVRIAV